MRSIQITYTRNRVIDITDAEHQAVRVMNSNNLRIDGIKFLREQYSLDLIEAKTLSDTIGIIPSAK